jgi:predicted enzyme involved in methoxymalonyl-ACP biosynthesis
MGLQLGSVSAATPLRGSDPLAGHVLPAADRRLRERLAECPHVHVFDPGSIAGRGPIFDDRLWLLGRIPFAEPFSRALARRCAGLVLAALEQTVRVLVVDMDNTLWGGVLGEDGREGLRIGGDFPGNAYSAFQQELLRLRPLEAMMITEDDLATWRIDWRPKWVNVEEIAADLNLGLGHVGFIDDNPLECELIRRNLPEVRVLELPDDPAGFAEALRGGRR